MSFSEFFYTRKMSKSDKEAKGARMMSLTPDERESDRVMYKKKRAHQKAQVTKKITFIDSLLRGTQIGEVEYHTAIEELKNLEEKMDLLLELQEQVILSGPEDGTDDPELSYLYS